MLNHKLLRAVLRNTGLARAAWGFLATFVAASALLRWWIQATCGLRLGERLSLERRDVGKLDGLTCLTVREEVSKTHKSRTSP